MNLLMSGMDHSMAGIDIRSRFSFTTSEKQRIYQYLKRYPGVLGVVLITTCNRTEIYLSCESGVRFDPFVLLCRAIGEPEEDYLHIHQYREGKEVLRHLCLLSCGAKSQIWGEDQIISQVKDALTAARENHMTDSYLEVLFRTAITAAKKIKTEIRFSHAGNSVASKALEVLERQQEIPRRVLVIGNGEVGKLTAQRLLEHGYQVTMTLRQYKHGSVDLPEGASTIDYAQRYEKMPGFDAVISATLSPHFTVEAERFFQVECPPKLFIDLAVPRDIDPNISKKSGISLYDIDSIAQNSVKENHALQLDQIDGIISKYEKDFEHWRKHKELLNV